MRDPDYDIDEALEELDSGILTYQEFKELVGPEAAAAYVSERHIIDDLFDDPEDF